jgi:hypothetical protein
MRSIHQEVPASSPGWVTKYRKSQQLKVHGVLHFHHIPPTSAPRAKIRNKSLIGDHVPVAHMSSLGYAQITQTNPSFIRTALISHDYCN